MDFDVLTPAPTPYVPQVPLDGTFGEEGIYGNKTTARGRRWLFSRVNFLQEMMKFLPPQRGITPISGEDLTGTLDENGAMCHSKERFPSSKDKDGNVIVDANGNPTAFWGSGTISKEKQTPGLDYYFGASEFQHFHYVGSDKAPKNNAEYQSDFNGVYYTDGHTGSIGEAMDAYEFDDMSYVYKRTGSGTAGAELGYVPDYSTLFDQEKGYLVNNENYFEFINDYFNKYPKTPSQDQGIAWILGLVESKRRIAYAMTDLFGSHRPQSKVYNFGYGSRDASTYGSDETEASKIAKIASWSDDNPADWRGQESGQLNQFMFTEYYELWDTAGQWVGALSAGKAFNADFAPLNGDPFNKYKAWIDNVFASFQDSWVFNGSFSGTKAALAGATSVDQVINALGGLKIKTANITKIIDDLKQGKPVKDAVNEILGFLNNFDASEYKSLVVTSLKAEYYGHLDDNGTYYPGQVGKLAGISMYPISSEGYNIFDRAQNHDTGNYVDSWMLNAEGWSGGGSWTDLPVIPDQSDPYWHNVDLARLRGGARGLFVGMSFFSLTPNASANLWQDGQPLGNVNLYNSSYNFRAYSNLLNKTKTYLDYTLQVGLMNKYNQRVNERKTEDYKAEKERVKEEKVNEMIAAAKSDAKARSRSSADKAAIEKANQKRIAERIAEMRKESLTAAKQKNKKK
ncbi:MAG: hypothetical protein PHG97_02520 [Candidatus Margulisbacteria bacterium]|nr:hypothetical protein [Candidatus Margulisiibacteriota bacterium]